MACSRSEQQKTGEGSRPGTEPSGETTDADSVPAEAIPFNLISATGETISFKPGVDKKLTVICFFSVTWDPDGKALLQRLTELHERSAPLGLRIIAISYDEQPKRVKSLVKNLPLAFEVAVGAKSTYERFGLRAIPTFLIIEPKGRLLERFEGHIGVEELQSKIEAYLPGRSAQP